MSSWQRTEITFIDIYSVIYCPWSVSLIITRLKDLLMKKHEERGDVIFRWRNAKKGENRRDVENRMLRHYETANVEIFVTCISSREETQATKRADDLRVPAGLLPCPPLRHGSRYLRPLCLGVGRYFGVNLVAGLTTRPENRVGILVLRYLRWYCEGKDGRERRYLFFKNHPSMKNDDFFRNEM